ncbi:alpha-2-macroglobulin receptor-associated protein isoform X2 [Eurytemora carolleeae]|uniref:alpha-2-macroglobulin receptor-associated protein isoform X2 n=1 Tax=Eurytemora carolleeae TaxID=1294199 RepID=UPI000C781691|nr:alpha-2-macroglobulin receptor-associated protein isoform X2 [Eurytemora carolleeae]|eukprot:XP_023329038.1 alpha-2-macroglobulin receptor-associated protein-like isoform X2 [Eurytemora affinis]
MIYSVFSVLLILGSLVSGTEDFYPEKDEIKSYATVQSPFRMQKINLVWEKARLKMELTETKLSKLYSELKVQDKEELTLKKFKSEGGDKEGLKENEIRKKFSMILTRYGMGGSGAGNTEQQIQTEIPKEFFKDKKLQKLWEKAEKSGLTSMELVALQEEFSHHQQKVDEYNRLLELAGKDEYLLSNNIQRNSENEAFDIRDTNSLKKKAKDVKSGFDRLHRLATNQGEYQGFVEPKVAGLWKIALEADFEAEELESLRQELSHYEKRLEKLRFLQSELELVDERRNTKYEDEVDDDDKTEGRRIMDRVQLICESAERIQVLELT